MSDEQSRLGQWTDIGGERVRSYFDAATESIRSRLDPYDITLDWLGKSPFQLGYGAQAPSDVDDDRIWRFQQMASYNYPVGSSSSNQYGQTKIGNVQFKVITHHRGPVPERMRERLREVDNPRLRYLFDTGEYAGYMSGFSFIEKATSYEHTTVALDEVPDVGLGIPTFEVEVYDEDGVLQGAADGHLNPYSTEEVTEEERVISERTPAPEEWTIFSKNEARGTYEFGPEAKTPARERAKNLNKTVYINGQPVSGLGTRGTGELRIDYERPSQAKYTDRETITETTGTPYQALSMHANLYKVRETEDKIMLSTTKPRGFTPVPDEEIDPATEGYDLIQNIVTELRIDDAEPTQFTVENDPDDIGWAMGKIEPPVVRDISNGIDWA